MCSSAIREEADMSDMVLHSQNATIGMDDLHKVTVVFVDRFNSEHVRSLEAGAC